MVFYQSFDSLIISDSDVCDIKEMPRLRHPDTKPSPSYLVSAKDENCNETNLCIKTWLSTLLSWMAYRNQGTASRIAILIKESARCSELRNRCSLLVSCPWYFGVTGYVHQVYINLYLSREIGIACKDYREAFIIFGCRRFHYCKSSGSRKLVGVKRIREVCVGLWWNNFHTIDLTLLQGRS